MHWFKDYEYDKNRTIIEYIKSVNIKRNGTYCENWFLNIYSCNIGVFTFAVLLTSL